MIIGQFVAQPGEQFPISEDFTAELDLEMGEFIATAVATSRNYATGVDTTTTFLVTGPIVQIDGGTIVSTLKAAGGGLPGETHIVTLNASTNFQNTYEHEVEVIITES
jgi:hypothetical protein